MSTITKLSKKAMDSASVKSLRQKVLTKAASSKTAPPAVTEEKDLSLQTSPVNAAEYVFSHQQDTSEVLESDFEGVETSSVGSGTSSCDRRVSLLYTTPKRGTGVQMDMVTGTANELLQKGKEALESAGKIKKEAKAACHDSLQGLYETVLSLSDSRNRHKCNLEKERAQHAQELMRIERAHNQEILAMKQTLVAEIHLVRKELSENLKETQAIRSWLGYETTDPFKNIKEIRERQERLEKALKESVEGIRRQEAEMDTQKWHVLESSLLQIKNFTSNLSIQVDDIKSEIKNTKTLVTEARSLTQEEVPNIPVYDSALRETIDNINKTMTGMEQTLISLPTYTPPKDLTPELCMLAEKIEIVSSELREMRNIHPIVNSPPRPSLETELTVQEVKQTLATIKKGVTELSMGDKPTLGKSTFAQIAAKPKTPQLPNHTLIISSKDQKDTSDTVMSKIKVTLDLKKTGARVDRVRKARDQKVVLKCASKEDMALVRSQVQTNGELSIREPANRNPLICVRGVLSCFTNEEIIDYVKSQNKHLLHGVGEADLGMKVRYRKRARNPHECHPVLELKPVVWKRFTEAEKIYIGFGRCSVEDQSPLIQCSKCLGYGHTAALCKSNTSTCCYCGGEHNRRDCPSEKKSEPPKCVNCVRAKKESAVLAHNAYSPECPERQKWDSIARSRVQYC